ncbi:MAG: hypothetical protein BWX72_01360 [Firmicutes bacterium ADurb.Bin080]|nr:MAG: hypothetical protein BWX72_01360 [Firmicutes bacterium ADurb.Bin080]
MKLAAEKNLNRYSFPVVATKGKPLSHNKAFKQGDFQFLCEKGILGAKQFMVLDAVATLAIHSTYNYPITQKINCNDRIPTMNDQRVKNNSESFMSKAMLEYMVKDTYQTGKDVIPECYYRDGGLLSIDSKYGRMKGVRSITINDGFLRKNLSVFKKYSSAEISEMIQRTADCKIKMYYPIRCCENDSYINIPNRIYKFSSSFFRLIDVKPSKLSKNGFVLERKYTLIFDTVLGYSFLQNVLSCFTDLLPEKFYFMTEYGQLFYRLLILPYYKNVKNPIGLKEIKNRLVLKTSNTTMVRKTIKRILDELEANSFIRAPKEIKKEGEYYYAYIRLKWEEINK